MFLAVSREIQVAIVGRWGSSSVDFFNKKTRESQRMILNGVARHTETQTALSRHQLLVATNLFHFHTNHQAPRPVETRSNIVRLTRTRH